MVNPKRDIIETGNGVVDIHDAATRIYKPKLNNIRPSIPTEIRVKRMLRDTWVVYEMHANGKAKKTCGMEG